MQQTLGGLIAKRRKEKGMTQLELARQVGVTDKAVSKWERNLSCPDVVTLPVLAGILEVSLDELMQVNTKKPHFSGESGATAGIVLPAVALAMGIAVTVLTWMNALAPDHAAAMLGLGLACLALWAIGSRTSLF